jgi:hypothetical protein
MNETSIAALIGGVVCLILCYVLFRSGLQPGIAQWWDKSHERQWPVLRYARMGCLLGLAVVIGLTGLLVLAALAFGGLD